MVPREMEYCPFCGTCELQRVSTSTTGPETYYECPNCGQIGTTGIGCVPTRTDE